jgi:hypothetical protein
MWLVACIGFLFLSLLELGLVMQAVTLLDKVANEPPTGRTFYSIIFSS